MMQTRPKPLVPLAQSASADQVLWAMKALLEDIADTSYQILQQLRGDDQQGIVQHITQPVTTAKVITLPFLQPFFSLVIINDGPNTVQYSIPAGFGHPDAINPGESFSFTTEKAVLRSIQLQAVGGDSTMRIIGLY